MFVVFDLDGTLSLNAHRLHFIRRPQSERDYASYHAACIHDELCEPVARVLLTHLSSGHKVEVWTGRSDVVRVETEAWFRRCNLWPGLVTRMRPEGDHRSNVDLKRAWLTEQRRTLQEPNLVYEDMTATVRMWRDEGVTCFQVADWEDPN